MLGTARLIKHIDMRNVSKLVLSQINELWSRQQLYMATGSVILMAERGYSLVLAYEAAKNQYLKWQ
jgi:hypothetical protein